MDKSQKHHAKYNKPVPKLFYLFKIPLTGKTKLCYDKQNRDGFWGTSIERMMSKGVFWSHQNVTCLS